MEDVGETTASRRTNSVQEALGRVCVCVCVCVCVFVVDAGGGMLGQDFCVA
jgi:hypothetical protein